MTRRTVTLFAALVVASLSCDRGPTAPGGESRVGALALDPQFDLPPSLQQSGLVADVVPFERVRIVLRREDGSIALDTLVVFPADANEISLSLSVPLSSAAGPSGEPLSLNMAYVNAAGDTVFRGGPLAVTAAAPGHSAPGGAVEVPVRYSGAGSNAARVVASPRTWSGLGGSAFEFSAVALADDGSQLPGTPVIWSSLNPSLATITTPGEGRGLAQEARGTTRIVAQLLTGPADTVDVTVQPLPRNIEVASGSAQVGPIGAALSQPIVARVLAADGLPVSGVNVSFGVPAGGGSVNPSSATTSAEGLAEAVWTLGTTIGAQQATATFNGFGGSPASFTATGQTVIPVRFEFSAQPGATVVAGVLIGPVAVTAFNAQNTVVTGYTGNVTVALTGGAATAQLLGTTTVAAVGGVATFADLRINVAGAGYTLNASVPTVAAATSSAFTVVSAPATRLAVANYPSDAPRAGVPLELVVHAVDPFGNLATSFAGTVTMGLATAPLTAVLGGTPTATALAGVATFDAAFVNRVGRYQFVFTAAALTSVTGPTSGIDVRAGPAASIEIVSGNGVTASMGSTIPGITVRVTDAFGNAVSGETVAFAIGAGGGSVAGAPGVTDDQGLAQVSWTLGATPGAQTIVVTSPGIPGGGAVTITVTAVAGPTVVATTTVAPKPDSLFSLGETLPLTATARDSSNVVVVGGFTWATRNAGVVTVSPTGVLTAVANGATWVVATELGGTRDSAHVVVQQRVASVNITPGARNIYLTRDFQLTATAVDGRGNTVPGVTTFTWSSVAPAIATVDIAGRVTGVALGAAQIRASFGAIIGTASISIITPITRIEVGRDSSGVAAAGATTMTALGISQRFRAIAHDTLDAVMPGVTFAWLSTNGSVALLDTINPTTASALSAANGITAIRATAQGVAGNATLTVQQVLAAIELTPGTASVAPTGTVQLTARGKDANNRYIPGGAFAYTSDAPGIATVTAAGTVTGVSVGTAQLTASSGPITSPANPIVVSNIVAPIISFGRDTLAVGRGGSTSIPILLSRPNPTPVTINLAARDTNAYFATASITIPANATSGNATLSGRNAGTTQIFATDGGGSGYAGDTTVVAVQANVQFAQGGWALNATDEVASQVLLSDPSPVGGTYVTFGYGTAGRAQVSPDPAFIPAGQLAADVVIRGLTAGSTSITPGATGVNGTAANLTVSAPVLTTSATSARLGVGQYEPNIYVYTPQTTNVAVPVTLTSSDTTIAVVTPTVTIPGGLYYAYFTVSSRAAGQVRIITSAPGWAPDTVLITVTSPHIGLCCGTTLNTTSPPHNLSAYAQDSTRNTHTRTNSLVVRAASSDTTVIKVLDTLVTMGANQSSVSPIRVRPNGAGGQAWVRLTAAGHTTDSALYTVVGPKLNFSTASARLGTGQYEPNVYVYTPDNLTQPLTLRFANSNPASATLPDSVIIPAGIYYSYFTINGIAPGATTFIVSANGYQPDTMTFVVTTPRVQVCCGGALNAFSTPQGVTVYAADSAATVHNRVTPLAVTLTSTDTTVLRVDSAVVGIVANNYYNNAARVTAVGVGTARIVVTAPGHRPDSVQYTVQTPKLNISFASVNVGARQYFGATDMYVYTPDTRTTPLTVTLTQSAPAVDSLPSTTLTIPIGLYYQYFSPYGKSPGIDTIIASAPGYLPDTAVVRVTTPRLINGGLPGAATTTNPPSAVYVYAADSLSNTHYASDTIVVSAVSSDTTVIQPSQRYFRILKGQYFVQTAVNYVGPGAASITYSDSAASGYLPTTTNNVTVTGPSLYFSSGTQRYGMRQRGGPSDVYVYVPNNVATPLTVNLTSTDTRVVTVPASVTIPAGSYYAYFTITALDTLGTIQVQATATGYTAAAPMAVQVTAPKFLISTSTTVNTTSPVQGMTVYATDAAGNTHYVTENVSITLTSSSPGVANIDSLTVTIPAGQYFTSAARWAPASAGSTQLSAADNRAVFYKYGTATHNVQVNVPPLSFSWTTSPLGIGQYFDQYVYAPDNQASNLTVGLSRPGAARTTTPGSVVIPTGIYYVYFRTTGLAIGTDTIVGASTTGAVHRPDTAYVVVDKGRVDPLGSWPASVRVGDSVQVQLHPRDPAGNNRNVIGATTFTLAPNANIQFKSGGPASAVITSVTVPADGTVVSFWVKGVSAGAGSVTITHTDYQTYVIGLTVNP